MENKKIDVKNKKYLIFKGGGGKGNAYLGVLRKLEENGILPLNKKASPILGVAGASAGAITALCVAIGMSIEDIKKQFNKPNFKVPYKFKGFRFEDFISKDVPNPGSYKAIEIVEKEEKKYSIKIGYVADTIYKNKYSDLNIKEIREDIKDEILNEIERLTGETVDVTELERRKLKKLREIRTNIAGGQETHITKKPIANTHLYVLNHKATPDIVNTFIKLRLSAAYHNSPNNAILKKLNEDLDNYLYNILYDRGLFCGTHVREYFQFLIDYYLKVYHTEGYKSIENKGLINFAEFRSITGVDLRVTGTNITAGENVIFSAEHTPFFPVSEAVAISMNIPGMFKPIYIRNKNSEGEEITYKKSNLKTGLYVDGGFLNNLPLTAFSKDGNNDDEILGFRVIEGPEPEMFNVDAPYILDDKNFSEKDRTRYANYLKVYIRENGTIPPKKEPAKKGMIAPSDRSIFETTLFSLFGLLLDTVLTDASNDEITPSNIKNVLDVYSYHIGTLDFTPNNYLLDFVEDRAYEKASKILEF